MSFWKTTRRAVLASAALLLTVGGVSAASPTMPENNRETIAQYFSLVDVAAKMPDGNVLALQGHNTYRFDANHKIVYLLVRNRS